MDSLGTTLSPVRYGLDDPSKHGRMHPIFNGVIREPSRSLSNTTFFIDSDADSDSETGETFEEPSPVDDTESLGHQTTSTASPAELETPQNQQPEHSPNLIFRLKSVKREKTQDCIEENCFRVTLASTQLDWESYQPDPVADPVPEIPAHLRSQSREGPVGLVTVPHTELDESIKEVGGWNTQQVAAWMLNSGFENSIVSSFQTHDINGGVLLDLSFDDLKDFDISSYGKRRQIWNEVEALRIEGALEDPMQSSNMRSDRIPSCTDLTDRTYRPEYQRNNRRSCSRASSASTTTVIQIKKSPSPHTVQQDIPRPHRCSKGEKCPKWQRQQSAIEDVDREHGPDTPPTENAARMSKRLTTVPEAKKDVAIQSKYAHGILANDVPVTERQMPQSAPNVKQFLEFQHVAQLAHQTPAMRNAPSPTPTTTLTVNTPQLEAFPRSPTGLDLRHPPRHSSLSGLPRLSIPPSPVTAKHAPSNSDSTVIHVKRDLSPTLAEQRPSRSTSVPSLTPVMPGSPAPTVIHQPCPSIRDRSASPIITTLRSASPATPATRTGTPTSAYSRAPSPGISSSRYVASLQTTVPPPSGIEPPVPAPLFNNRSTTPSPDPSSARSIYTRSTTPSPDPFATKANSIVTGRRPPVLRAPLSAEALPRRRNITPLPTLQETNPKKANRVSKPLPATPRKSTSSDEAPPPVPAFTKPAVAPVSTTKLDTTSKPEPFASAAPIQISPIKTSATTPITATGTTFSPMTPATPFTPMTPITPATPATNTTTIPPLPRFPAKLPRQAYGPDTLRVGWVRRRRARLWRHEWTSAHLRLTNTSLAIHATNKPDDTIPLESIDVDDYIVACSSVNGGGKLAAAVRSLRLHGGKGTAASVMGTTALGATDADGAFSWQLVPAAAVGEKAGHVRTEKNNDGEETTIVVKKQGAPADAGKEAKVVLKTHHFAVKTRDERIDWMREVMLAKALRQKQLLKAAESGGVGRPLTRAGSF